MLPRDQHSVKMRWILDRSGQNPLQRQVGTKMQGTAWFRNHIPRNAYMTVKDWKDFFFLFQAEPEEQKRQQLWGPGGKPHYFTVACQGARQSPR